MKSRGPIKLKTNKTGVSGVIFHREKAKTGNGWYLDWQVFWLEKKGQKRSKSFFFSRYKTPKEAFFAAVNFRRQKEKELYGYTIIDKSEYNVYWNTAKQTVVYN